MSQDSKQHVMPNAEDQRKENYEPPVAETMVIIGRGRGGGVRGGPRGEEWLGGGGGGGGGGGVSYGTLTMEADDSAESTGTASAQPSASETAAGLFGPWAAGDPHTSLLPSAGDCPGLLGTACCHCGAPYS